MNCIFSAHRSAVPIDACALGYGYGGHAGGGVGGAGPRDSSFLQQAAYITGAVLTGLMGVALSQRSAGADRTRLD